MKNKKISDALTNIDAEYIEKAADYSVKKKHKKLGWLKWGAAAACFTLAIFAGIKLLPQNEPDRFSELPMLSISETVTGMGYEGYMAYDCSELVNANPLTENVKATALPVYQNPLSYDGNNVVSGADFDKMEEFLMDIAGKLGLDTSNLTITDDAPNEETKQKIIEKLQKVGSTVPEGYFNPTKLKAEADGVKIEVDRSMTATIRFTTAVRLPEEYNFTYFASYEDNVAVAEYLKSEYRELFGAEEPRINVCGGDYDTDGQQKYSIEIFDAGKNDIEQIVNYNFNRVVFSRDDNGELFMIRIYKPNLSKKLGDYPIIDSEQAKELLSNGNYITTVPNEFPGEEYIKKTELIYRTGEYEEYYMPYYRFYVELPDKEQENRLKTYGAYYVPAVESAYISNVPTWDGEFNS